MRRHRLDIRLLVALAAVAAALVSAAPAPALVTLPPGTIQLPETGSFLYLNSQAGDYIGQGREQLYTAGDNVMSASIDAPHTFVRAGATQFLAHDWGVAIAAPQGQALAVGSYTGAMRAEFRDPGKPGLDVSGDGKGCNTLSGKFDVLALEYDGDGNLTLLDVIFEQHCEGYGPALFGRLRYDALAPAVAMTDAPDASTRDTAASFGFSSSIDGANFQCKLDEGAFSACTSPKTYTGLAGGTHTFAVQATSDGHTGVPNQRTWTIAADAPILTLPPGAITVPETGSFLYLNSQSGEYVGDGREQLYPIGDAAISTSIDSGHSFFRASISRGLAHTWHVDVATPPGWAFAARQYSGAMRATFRGATPGLDVFGDGKGCNVLTGTIRVLAVEYQADGSLGLFDALFEQHCEGLTPALFGRIRYDALAPAVAMKDAPDLLTRDTSASFSFASSTDGAGFQCKLDGGAFSACASPKTYSNLGSGTHTFTVQASSAGHTSAPTRRVWTVAADAPILTLPPGAITVPDAGSFLYLNSQIGDWVGGGKEALYTQNDSAISAFRSTPWDYFGFQVSQGSHWWFVHVAAPLGWTLAAGQYSGAMRATFRDAGVPGLDVFGDGNGCNVLTGRIKVLAVEYDVDGDLRLLDALFEQHCEGGTPALFGRIRYDASAPAVHITGAPAQQTTDDTASFSFTSAVGATFACKLDSSAFSACASPKAYSGLLGGTHRFTVQSTVAGHASAPATYTWTIDRGPPETSITGHPPDPSNQTTAVFTFESNDIGATFTCRLDGAASSDCTSPLTVSGLADGAHMFQVAATNSLGQSDASPASYSWLVDASPPDTTIVDKPASVSTQTSASFSFGSSEAASTFECGLDGAAFAACSNPVTFAGIAQGAHTLRVRAKDQAGNVDASPVSYSWTVDSVPPSLAITAHPANPTSSKTAAFSFSVEAGATVTCKLDSGKVSRCTSPKSFKGLKGGSHTFLVNAVDAAGNSAQAAYTWAVDLTAPQTTITSHPTNPTPSTTASFEFSSSESGSTFECALDKAQYAPCAAPTTFNGLAPGTHKFRVRAIDATGNADRSAAAFTWKIK